MAPEMQHGPDADRRCDAMKSFLRAEKTREGFEAIGFVDPRAIAQAGEKLDMFLDLGRHGTMTWMQTTRQRRRDPSVLWPAVRSIAMFAMNYGPGDDPLALLERRDRAAISVYARNRDYHDVMKGKLKQIAGRFAARFDAKVKVFVDTAPVMEKPLAEQAGLGWQGKHTNLVSRASGSWLFLGSIFTDATIAPDRAETDHCGSCRACLDICPTEAFPAPYQLDARRCISYLTIEHKGAIPVAFRRAIGNRIYGCDDCLAVCPWNKFASLAREQKLVAREALTAPSIGDLLALDEARFRALFSGSPIKRIGRARFLRNVLIAAGNSQDSGLANASIALLKDPSPLVRGAAVWALSRLVDRRRLERLSTVHAAEGEQSVKAEWRLALNAGNTERQGIA